LLYAAQCANWQRGGGKGNEPQPVRFPEDRETKVRDQDDLAERKRAQNAHLKRRRVEKLKEVSSRVR